jgi:hypothetical protein
MFNKGGTFSSWVNNLCLKHTVLKCKIEPKCFTGSYICLLCLVTAHNCIYICFIICWMLQFYIFFLSFFPSYILVCVCVTEVPILQIKYAVKSTAVSLEHFIQFSDDVWNSYDVVLPWKDILSRDLYVGPCRAVLV